MSSSPKPRRTHAKRCCLRCRASKTRCELPNVHVEASNQALPPSLSCHRCRVLSRPCIVADKGWQPVVHRSKDGSTKSNTKNTSSNGNKRNARREKTSNTTISSNSSSTAATNVNDNNNSDSDFSLVSLPKLELLWPLFSYEANISLGLFSHQEDVDDVETSHRTGRINQTILPQYFRQLELHPQFRSGTAPRQLDTNLPQIVVHLITDDLHEILQKRYSHILLWAPFIEEPEKIRNTCISLQDISASLLLALVYYLSSEGLDYPNMPKIRDQLLAIIRRDCLHVMMQAPVCLYAIHALFLLSSMYPLCDDLNPLHVENGSITISMTIARSLGLDKTPFEIISKTQNKQPITQDLINKAACWYGLCSSHAEFAFSDLRVNRPTLSSPCVDPRKVLSLEILYLTTQATSSLNSSPNSSSNQSSPNTADSNMNSNTNNNNNNNNFANYTRSIRWAGFLGIGHRLHALESLHEAWEKVTLYNNSSSSTSVSELCDFIKNFCEEFKIEATKCEHDFYEFSASPMCTAPEDLIFSLHDWISIKFDGIVTILISYGVRSKVFTPFKTVPTVPHLLRHMHGNRDIGTIASTLGKLKTEKVEQILAKFCQLCQKRKFLSKRKNTAFLNFPWLEICAILFASSRFLMETIAVGLIGYDSISNRTDLCTLILERVAEGLHDIDQHNSVEQGSVPIATSQYIYTISSRIKTWRKLKLAQAHNIVQTPVNDERLINGLDFGHTSSIPVAIDSQTNTVALPAHTQESEAWISMFISNLNNNNNQPFISHQQLPQNHQQPENSHIIDNNNNLWPALQ